MSKPSAKASVPFIQDNLATLGSELHYAAQGKKPPPFAPYQIADYAI